MTPFFTREGVPSRPNFETRPVNVVTLRILGECTIAAGEVKVTPSASHLFALLLYLGVERGREVPRSTLFELLFPGESPAAAAHNLRQLLYRVRKLGVAVHSSPSAVRLDPSAVTDVVQQRLARPYHESSKDPGSSVTLLPGYQPPTAPFSKWVESYREGMNRSLIRKLGDELHSARRGANWATVEAFASALLTLDPFNETATLCLAESLARSGSKQRAVSMLETFEQEVGAPSSGLALPSRLLKRRISESSLEEGCDRAASPLVGRTREMEVLADLWARARNGQCTTVSITGEKSIGKSRLATELLSMARLDGSGSIVLSRRRPQDRERPLSLFADICKQLIGMPGAAGCSPKGLSFLSRLTSATDGFSSLRAEQSEVQFATGNVRRAIIELVECVSHERPLILATDDVRFLDGSSRVILRDIGHELPTSRLLIITIGDSDDTHWPDAYGLRLNALEEGALAQVAIHAAARREWPIRDELLRWCVGMAGGNPGYLELLLQSAHTTSMQQLPRDLIALVEERIVALSPNARHALQAIALFGAGCSGDLIERLCGLQRTALLEALQELETCSMIITGREGASCRSALIEECTRASTPASVACVLHARAARYLERLTQQYPPTQSDAWRIAAHYRDARMFERARHWRRICWRQSIAIGQPRVAVLDIQNALAAPPDVQERAALVDDLAGALFAAGDLLGVEQALRERRSLCVQLREGPAVRERVRFDEIEAKVLSGDDPMPLQLPLRELVESTYLDISRRIRAARTLMIVADHELNAALAAEVYGINQKFEPADDASALLHAQTSLIYHSVFGDYDRAIEEIRCLQRLVECADPSWAALTTRSNLALAQELVVCDSFDLSDLERAFDECRAAEMNQMAISLAGRLGCCWVDRGEISKAATVILAAQALVGRPGTERLSLNFISCCVDLALLDSDFAQARMHIESVRTFLPAFATGSVRNYWKLYHLRWQQLSSTTRMAITDLEWLLARHQRVRAQGRNDDSVETLWIALSNAGRREEATRLLSDYLLLWRRERRPCGYLLRLRTDSDPIWDRVRLLPTGGYAPITD